MMKLSSFKNELITFWALASDILKTFYYAIDFLQNKKMYFFTVGVMDCLKSYPIPSMVFNLADHLVIFIHLQNPLTIFNFFLSCFHIQYKCFQIQNRSVFFNSPLKL